MNILTGVHSTENSSTVTIFYTRFPTVDGLNKIVNRPETGAKKCEMFKRGYIAKVSLFEYGLTFKFKEPGTIMHGVEQKGLRSFKIHLHPETLENQIYTLADLIEDCGLSGLSVLEYFSKLLSDIETSKYNKTA